MNQSLPIDSQRSLAHMHSIRRWVLAIPLTICIAVVLFLPDGTARAAAMKDRVTIVVLDQSGSMRLNLPTKQPRTKASDPLGLRCSAVRLLADLATTRDSLGLIKLESHDDKTGPTADRTAEVLIAPTPMGTAQSRDAFKAKVDCTQATNNTPIADALQQAYDLLAAVAQARGNNTFEGQVILLTDGDPQPQRDVQLREIDQLLPRFARQHWSISTVGLKLRANKNTIAINLLQKIAGATQGRAYDDVDQPLQLQNVFIDFFAQQTGRSLLAGITEHLTPNGESRVSVADYALRIDVLVAKSDPNAQISLRRPGPDYSEVSESASDVELFSTSDRYYAAFSIAKPIKGVWSIRVDRPTDVIVNVLVESHIQVRLENAEITRPSNEPLLIQARFYNRQDDGTAMPATVPNASVNVDVKIRARAYAVPLRDDGQPPDAAPNDGLYTGVLTLDPVASEEGPATADVTLTAKVADAEYTDHRSLQLAAVPAIAPALDEDALRLPPGNPIEVPLQLMLGQRRIDPTGWQVLVRQTLAGEQRRVDVRQQNGIFVATLLPQTDDQETYVFDADIVGVDQNAGLKRVQQNMQVRVVFQQTLKLYYSVLGAVPVGAPITMTAALLRSFDTPAPLRAPLQLNVQRDDEPAQPISGVQESGRGFFAYRFVPRLPGQYHFTLLPPDGSTLTAVKQDVVVAPIPEVRWQSQSAKDARLLVRAAQWPWLDRLRRVPLARWPADLLFPSARSESVQLGGQAWSGEQLYTGTLALTLLAADGTPIHTETVSDGAITAAWDLPSGDYRLDVEFPGAFAPPIVCCRSETPLTVVRDVPLSDLGRFAGIVAGEALVLLLLGIIARYVFSPRPLAGDRLIFTVNGKELAVDLKGEQRFAILWPSQIKLTNYFRRRNRSNPGLPKQGRARTTRDGVEFNGQTVPKGQNKQIDGSVVRYEPGWLRSKTAGGRKGQPPSRRLGSAAAQAPTTRTQHASSAGWLSRLMKSLGLGRRKPSGQTRRPIKPGSGGRTATATRRRK